MRIVTLVTVLGLAVGTARAQVTQPLDGAWHLSGRLRTYACADRCASRRHTIDKQIVVTNGDVIGGDGLACDGAVSADEFAAATTLVPAPRGWLRMKVVDRARFLAVMRSCIGYQSLRLSRTSIRVRIAADGQSFDERVSFAGSVRVRGQTVTFTASGRAHGDWLGTADTARDVPRRTVLGTLLDAALRTD